MQLGDIYIVPFPFENEKIIKVRPAVVVEINEDKCTLAKITTKERAYDNSSVTLASWQDAGLDKQSYVRCDKAAEFDLKNIPDGYKIGQMQKSDLDKVITTYNLRSKPMNPASITHFVSSDEDFFVYAQFGGTTLSSLTRFGEVQGLHLKHNKTMEEAFLGIDYYGNYNPNYKPYDLVHCPMPQNRERAFEDEPLYMRPAFATIDTAKNMYIFTDGKNKIHLEMPLDKAQFVCKQTSDEYDLDELNQNSYDELAEKLNMRFKEYQEEEQLRVVVVEPGKAAYEQFIPDTLRAKQKIVGGLIEPVYYLHDKNAIIIGNEEARILELEPNRSFHEFNSILCGTFFICGDSGEDFTSLTKEQSEKFLEIFEKPEQFTDKQRQQAHVCTMTFISFKDDDSLSASVQKNVETRGGPKK